MLFWRKFFIVCTALMPMVVSAQVVKDIEVEGLSRFSKSTVLVYSAVAVEDDLTEADIKAIINNLFVTDFFDEISVNLDDNGLLKISVVEKPVIANITTTGNSHMNESQIESSLVDQGISVGRTFNQRKIEHFKRQILSMYTFDGYYNAMVNITHTKTAQGRIDLKIAIQEGQVASISKIVIHGNKAISDANIKSAMNGQVSNPLSFFLGTDKYSQYALEQDTMLIERYYATKGYPKAKVLNYKASLNETKSGIIIDIFIDEGSYQQIDGFEVEGIEGFDVSKSHDSSLPMAYSIEVIEDIQRFIKRDLHDQGFFLQKINYSLIQKDGKNIILFQIHKGSPIYLNSINISGNNTTREGVIRNHITLPEGSLFSAAKIDDIEDSLNRTGFFEEVNIQSIPLNSESVDLNINIKEAKTKRFTAGVQLSNITLGCNLEVEDKNLFGTGYNVNFRTDVDEYEKDLSFSITDPYAFNNRISLSYIFDKKKHQYQNKHLLSQASVDKINHSLGTGFFVGSKTRFSTFLQYSRERLPEKSVDVIQHQLSLSGNKSNGDIYSYGVKNSLAVETYNFYRFPTRGYKAVLSLYCNTPMSDFNFFDVSASVAKIVPLRQGFLWYSSLTSRYSIPYGSGSKAYIPSSHFLNCGGSQDVRGYSYYAMGPQYNDKIVEGNLKFVLRNELVVPNKFLGIETDAVRLSAFLDAGQLYRTYRTNNIKQPRGFCFSTGVSIRWVSPILPPLSISFNLPLNKNKSAGKVEYFSFSNMIEF